MFPYLNILDMPIAQSTLMDSQVFKIHLNSHRLPKTLEMVEEAIQTLNTTRGISLQKLKKYIIEKYQIEMKAKRYTLIKAHLHTLLSNGTLMSVTGRGLSGSFRLVKRGKSKTGSVPKNDTTGAEGTISDAKKKATGGGNTDGNIGVRQRKIGVSKAKNDKTKKGKNVTATQLAETPPNYVTHLMEPHAPHRNSTATDLSHVEQVDGTPRSAGTRVGRKRKLVPLPEPVTASQEF